MMNPFPNAPLAADTFNAFVGCDRQLTTCASYQTPVVTGAMATFQTQTIGGVSYFTMTVTTPPSSGSFNIGQEILSSGLSAGTQITKIITAGIVYALNTTHANIVTPQAVSADVTVTGATASFATNVMTVTSVGTGTFMIGQTVIANGVPTGTTITAFKTGIGGTGTYALSTTVGTISSETVNAYFGNQANFRGMPWIPPVSVIT
jgi:hypothetical protein